MVFACFSTPGVDVPGIFFGVLERLVQSLPPRLNTLIVPFARWTARGLQSNLTSWIQRSPADNFSIGDANAVLKKPGSDALTPAEGGFTRG